VKKIIKILLWVCSAVGFILLIVYINKIQNETPCRIVNINIDTQHNLFFLQSNDVWKMIFKEGDSLIGTQMGLINTKLLEESISKNVYVQSVYVYKSFGGEINIDITQRRPIIRCMTTGGQHFYIDENGGFMPVSKNFTPRLIIAHGHLGMHEIKQRVLYEKDTAKYNKVYHKTNLNDVYAMAKYIDTSTYWKAQLSEIVVNSKEDITLIPQYWPHIIQFGDSKNMVEKFDKLYLFYSKELNKFDLQKYSRINLKYNNQIVCVKK